MSSGMNEKNEMEKEMHFETENPRAMPIKPCKVVIYSIP